MKLLFISHKEIWKDPSSPSGFATAGGFPFQLRAISELFSSTVLIAALRSTEKPNGTIALEGYNLSLLPLPEPHGIGWKRKLSLGIWLTRHLRTVVRTIKTVDAVHAPVPGDLGTIGLLVTLLFRKKLFIRHCGTWGNRTTLADRFLDWLLPKIAGKRAVVFATGGGSEPPSKANSAIKWIFSTSISQKEFDNLPISQPWVSGQQLRLVTVGRMTKGKNIETIIRALPQITERIPSVSLDIIGDGPERARLDNLCDELNIQYSSSSSRSPASNTSPHTSHIPHLISSVHFQGNVPHERVLEILAHSHLFVFPTRVKEGFPKAVLEAMACGLPVIASNVSVIPHLINGCGIVLDNPAPNDVAHAVMSIISSEDALRIMAMIARNSAQEYSLENWRDEIGKILRAAWNIETLKGQLVVAEA